METILSSRCLIPVPNVGINHEGCWTEEGDQRCDDREHFVDYELALLRVSEGVGDVDLGGVEAGQHGQEAGHEASQPAQEDETERPGPGVGGRVTERSDHDSLESVPTDEEEVEDGHGAHRDVQGVVHLAHRPTQGPPPQELHGGAREHH